MDNGQIGQYTNNSYYNISAETGAYKPKEGISTALMAKASADAVFVQKNTGEVLSTEAVGNVDKTLKNFIIDALKAAGLPQNERMMQLVKSLLDRQQPVDRNTLLSYNRLLGQNPGVSPETLIAMQKNGFNISKESIVQFENYQNNENQLFKNIDDAAGNIGGLVRELVSENSGEAARLLDGLAKFVNEMGLKVGGQGAEAMVTDMPASADASANQVSQQMSAVQVAVSKGMVGQQQIQLQADGIGAEQQAGTLEESFEAMLLKEFEEQLPAEVKEKISAGNLFEKLSAMIDNLPQEKAAELAKKLDTKELAGLVKETLKGALFLEPEAVADKEKLTEYYKKLDASVKEFLNVARELGDTVNNSVLARSFNNISDNVAFMNQVNEYMPYVQLPLKLLKEEAHGEFYVMKRRRQQSQQQGDTLTAFLRLNMEHLGELDIMVKLKGIALDVDIKAEKAEIVDFIEGSINILDARLKEKGYIPAMRVGEKEKEFDFEKDFLETEGNEGTIGRYSFDMKI